MTRNRILLAAALCVAAGIALVAALLPSDDGAEGSAARPTSGARLARTYLVNGLPMYLECRGTGAPVVILDAGLGVLPGPTWAGLVPRLAARTRTCFYERPGLGRSAPAPPPRTSAAIVAELRGLLRAAQVHGPYVLVGASFGGLNMQLLAAQHPDDVAGVVLVDSLHPDFDRRFAALMGARAATERAATLARNGEGIRFADLLASDREVKAAARGFPPVPLRVLVHSDSFDPGGRPVPRLERVWRALQHDLGRLSPESEVEIVPGTTHRIAEDAPDAVAAAVTSVLAQARGR
jgi:pimeloyl-ACP methyl ester carboxylesterase